MEYIKSKIRDVKDFPTKGVIFKDLTTVFKDPRALHVIGWDLSQLYRDKGITKVVGIESRGFIGGSILAFELGAGFVPARKPGKLPADTVRAEYKKEYGTDVIEMHRDAIGRNNGCRLRTGEKYEPQKGLYQFHYRTERSQWPCGFACRCRGDFADRLLIGAITPVGWVCALPCGRCSAFRRHQ